MNVERKILSHSKRKEIPWIKKKKGEYGKYC